MLAFSSESMGDVFWKDAKVGLSDFYTLKYSIQYSGGNNYS